MVSASVAVAVTLLVAAAHVLQDCPASAARVLGVFPHHGYSHHVMFEAYMRALADRGHDVHVISNFESRHPAIRDIDLRGSMPLHNNNVSFPGAVRSFGPLGSWSDVMSLYAMAEEAAAGFRVPAVQSLIRDPTAAYDLVVTEHFNTELPLGFVAKYRVPFVLLSSCQLLPWTVAAVGESQYTAIRPSTLGGLAARAMNLGQRLANTVDALTSLAAFRLFHRPRSQRAIREHFGLDVDLEQLASNVSLVLVNTHWTVNGVSPSLPNVVEVGGLHVEPPEPLPEDTESKVMMTIQKTKNNPAHNYNFIQSSPLYCDQLIIHQETL